MTRVAAGLVVAGNLSQAWLETTKDIRASSGEAFHTLTRIADPMAEDPVIRDAYDDLLRALGFPSAETVANTIFPSAMAARAATPTELVARYVGIPRVAAIPAQPKGHLLRPDRGLPQPRWTSRSTRAAGRQVGFELATPGPMSARYEVGVAIADEGEHDHSSTHLDGDGRSSAETGRTEAAEVAVPIFAPHKDTSRRAFPCLSLLSFQLDHDRVHLSAQYRYEYLVEKGYGNYLGLARLLKYVANSVGLVPGQMTVAAGRIKSDASAKVLAEHLGDAWAAA